MQERLPATTVTATEKKNIAGSNSIITSLLHFGKCHVINIHYILTAWSNGQRMYYALALYRLLSYDTIANAHIESHVISL